MATGTELELELPSHNISDIWPEFLNRHRKHKGNGGSDDNDDERLFQFCWRRQSCGSCLEASKACSWCAISSTCIPNRSPFPLLAPLENHTLCPLGPHERWELRSTPLGCNVSTATFLTGVVSVLSTLVLVLVGWVVVVFMKMGWRGFVSMRRRENGTGTGAGPGSGWEWMDGFRFVVGGRRWLDRMGQRRVVVVFDEGRDGGERRPLLV
ncbi:hypothetical protein PABG_00447 [Paracoccidioides brasiliensis Pb03]|uniref:PSI domain-containing protein n=1 Tax=Paracoccidioides brasiliensis (strain Pb18) TaxID=502780 RepID=C1G6Q4_PARBD|nr:uncharacterized protein PADG_02859 [Paracoccidioides brasiliensis Pb18]EEH17884.2 hypothetical protein PABG_00447 [Paracoccidioides brasiliensis Pb03]EEH46761.1 hypothetical protein PADG_02859 [Paracoccidioides brasiliensis Pb18]